MLWLCADYLHMTYKDHRYAHECCQCHTWWHNKVSKVKAPAAIAINSRTPYSIKQLVKSKSFKNNKTFQKHLKWNMLQMNKQSTMFTNLWCLPHTMYFGKEFHVTFTPHLSRPWEVSNRAFKKAQWENKSSNMNKIHVKQLLLVQWL